MNSTVVIIFSTITGNAYKLAAAAAEVVPDHVGPYNIRYITDEVIDKFDAFLLSYWCDRGSADPDTLALLERLHGKNLVVVGSLGASRASQHAADVCARVSAAAAAHNRLLGHFLCQGSIDLARTAAKVRAGTLSPERFERQKASQGHPDAHDLAELRTAVAGFLAAT